MATVIEALTKLLTAEEFLRLPENGQRRQLVQGVVLVMNMPGFRHGEVCSRIDRKVGNFVEERDLGRTVSNDSGIITGRNPDTVRGADVAYYSYRRVAKGDSPVGYAGVAPEIVFEVVSPYNDRTEIALKTGEYLRAGVNVVCVIDPQFQTVNLHYPDRPSATLRGEDSLTFAELPGFQVAASKLFV
ncbi:MAG: Uma2 family endonuclease [Pirellulaceae bacterium]